MMGACYDTIRMEKLPVSLEMATKVCGKEFLSKNMAVQNLTLRAPVVSIQSLSVLIMTCAKQLS